MNESFYKCVFESFALSWATDFITGIGKLPLAVFYVCLRVKRSYFITENIYILKKTNQINVAKNK